MAYDPQARRARPRPTTDSPVDSLLEAIPVVGGGPVPSEISVEVDPEVAAEVVDEVLELDTVPAVPTVSVLALLVSPIVTDEEVMDEAPRLAVP